MVDSKKPIITTFATKSKDKEKLHNISLVKKYCFNNGITFSFMMHMAIEKLVKDYELHKD